MPVEAVPSVPSSNPTQSDAVSDGLGRDAFLQLLVAQLRYQDPMDPADSDEMMMQTAMFTQVELSERIASQQEELLSATELAAATSLLGQQVDGAVGGEDISGLVTGIDHGDDGSVQLRTPAGNLPLRDVASAAAPDNPGGDDGE